MQHPVVVVIGRHMAHRFTDFPRSIPHRHAKPRLQKPVSYTHLMAVVADEPTAHIISLTSTGMENFI